VRWPTSASLDRATPSTAKTGKPHRDLAEMRRDRMVPVVLHVTNPTTVSAIRPPNRLAPGLGGNDLLLEACQHPLPVGHGQTQVGDIVKIIWPANLHDVGERLFTVSPDFHQPHNPSHASTPGQITDAKIALWLSHPQTCGGPAAAIGAGGVLLKDRVATRGAQFVALRIGTLLLGGDRA